MELLTSLFGFLGSWLLVAGPIYQAALELRDENIEQEHFRAVQATLPPVVRVSAWWWLLPPVKMMLEHKFNDAYRQKFLESLPYEDVEALLSFINKATAWLIVGAGGLLVALRETYVVTEEAHLEWPYFLAVSAICFFLCVSFTAVSVGRSDTIRKMRKDS